MTTFDHDVVIAGLGPTGLTLANLLGRRGIDVLVLEREPEYYGLARAVYTDDEGMRVFQTAGAADELATDMIVDSTVQWVRGDGSVLAQFQDIARPLGWPVSNFLYQPYLENTLERALERYPHVTVRRGREVVDFDQTADSVSVEHAESRGTGYGKHTLESGPRTAERVRARFLVGCDGGRSVVRTELGIDMRGTSFPERWLVVDLKAREGVDAFRHLPYFDFVCDPVLPTVSCPQPDRHHRFEFMLSDSQTKEEMEDPETVRRHISRFVDPGEVDVLRKLVYTFNAVVAQQWRVGRILIAGDAAHMTPQFIGQGMNSGVRDADNLSWKLAAIIEHGAALRILDTYESERRPHAKAMIDLSVLNKNIVSIDNKLIAAARDIGLAAAMRTPGLRGWVRAAKMKPRPRFRRGAYLGLPRGRLRAVAGTLAPQPQVRTYEGRHQRLDDALGTGFAILGHSVDPRTVLGADDLAVLRALGARVVVAYPIGGRPQGRPGDGRGSGAEFRDIEDHTGALMKWLAKAGVGAGGLVLLRPDRYVFGTATGPDRDALVGELARQLGISHSGALMNDLPPDQSTGTSRRRLLGTAVGTLGAAAMAGGVSAVRAGAAPARREAPPSGNYRIDLHAHFLPPDYRASLLEHGHLTIGGYPTPDWSPEQALGFMDYYGIQAQALSVSDPGVSYLRGKEAIDMARYCNTYAAGLFQAHPTRFGAFAVLPMPDIAASIAEAIHALDTLHLDGVILLSAYDGVYLGDPRFEPLMIALNQRKAFVFVHPAAIPEQSKPKLPLPDFLEEFTFDTTRAATMMMVTGVTQRYRDIRFQLAHAGGTLPFLSHRIGVASQTVIGRTWPAGLPKPSVLDIRNQISHFYYDTALSGSPAAMAGVLAVTARDHIVFGSDWPFSAATLPQSGSHDPAPGLGDIFDAEQRVEVEHHNPLRQLPRLRQAVGG